MNERGTLMELPAGKLNQCQAMFSRRFKSIGMKMLVFRRNLPDAA
jgi:hypothetical protein